MKTFTLFTCIVSMVGAFLIGCGDDTEDTTPMDSEPVDTNPVDTNPVDTNPVDTNPVDTNPDTNNTGACVLIADANGWVGAETNSCGAQGSWFSYHDDLASFFGDADAEGNQVPGSDTAALRVTAAGGYCAKGVAKMSNPPDYTIWGAGIGLNLCADADGNVSGIGSCPITPSLAGMTGVKVTLSGNIGSDLRVTMSEVDRDESCYLPGALTDENGNAEIEYYFADAEVGYRPSDPLVDVTKVKSIQFQASSNADADEAFDFCVEKIEVLFTPPPGADTDTNAGM